MARNARPFIDISGIEDLKAQFDALGRYAFGDALQEAVNVVAEVAQRRMATGFDRDIEGGPARFTRIDPMSRASSVMVRRHKGATKGVASAEVEVPPKQAQYLAFMLGVDDVRRPGESGIATKRNFIGNAASLVRVGLTMTSQGNLPLRALDKLTALRKRGSADHGNRGTDFTRDFDADRDDRAAGRGSGETVFYGSPLGNTRRGRRAEGFWLRPMSSTMEDGKRRTSAAKKGGLVLLAAALPVFRYDEDYLVPAWNDAVEGAGRTLDEIAREVLEERLDRYHQGRQARADRKDAGAREARAQARARRLEAGERVNVGQLHSAAGRRASRST